MTKKVIIAIGFMGVFYILYLTSFTTVNPEKQEYVYEPEKKELFEDTPIAEKHVAKTKKTLGAKNQEILKKENVQLMTETELITSLHASLDTVDTRTPKLISEEDRKVLEPTKEQREDPKEFAKYEAALNEQSRQSFAVSNRLIESTRENIQKAEEEGTRSKEEIDEAKEALAKMEEAQQIMAEENIEAKDEAI